MIPECIVAARIINAIWSIKILKDTRGQDIMEYALFVAAIGTLYAAVSPDVAVSVSSIFSKINSTMSGAANTGH